MSQIELDADWPSSALRMLHIKTFHMLLLLPRAESAIVACCCGEKSAGLTECIPCRIFVNTGSQTRGRRTNKKRAFVKLLIINGLYKRRAEDGNLVMDFADSAITTLIFDSVFVESLHLGKGVEEVTRRLVEGISVAKGRPVYAKDIARKLGISMDLAYGEETSIAIERLTPRWTA
jgi:hypothetical protein